MAQPRKPFVVTIDEAARLIAVSRSTIHKMIREDDLLTIRIGANHTGDQRIVYASLQGWFVARLNDRSRTIARAQKEASGK